MFPQVVYSVPVWGFALFRQYRTIVIFIWQVSSSLPVGSFILLPQIVFSIAHTHGGVVAESDGR
jgi:hypothetical protein